MSIYLFMYVSIAISLPVGAEGVPQVIQFLLSFPGSHQLPPFLAVTFAMSDIPGYLRIIKRYRSEFWK